MEQTNCRSIKSSLVALFADQTECVATPNHCIVTLPLLTLDGRLMDVYVEDTLGDVVLVHDGGKTVAELYSHGIHVTDAKRALFKSLAASYGASFEAGTFTIACRKTEAQSAILRLSQCANLAMFDLLKNAPVIEDEPILSRVGRALEKWRPPSVALRRRLHIKGQTEAADHVFDYVAFGVGERRKNVAVSVLTPTYKPELQAHNYGFMVKDIDGTDFEKWPRLAVITKRERWSEDEKRLVRSLSQATLELETPQGAEVEEKLPTLIERLAA
jgi:hypothetical protein